MLITTASPGDELVSLEEAKRHLRIMQSGLDDEIAEKLAAARGWCESQVSRTLRAAVGRTYSMPAWWCGSLDLPYPPALAVQTVKYYSGGTLATLASSNYRVLADTDGVTRVEWTDTAVVPASDSRADAVQVAYTAGYTALPAKAKVAILLALSVFWGDAKETEASVAERSAKALLSSLDWGCYR